MSRKVANRNGLTDAGYLALRTIVAHEQNWVCQLCKNELNPPMWGLHHIDENPKNNRRSNLVLLCHKCHKEIHSLTISVDEQLKRYYK